MKGRYDKNLVFYISVALYAVYIFLVNWSLSASKTNITWLGDAFSFLSNIVLVICCALIVYRIARDLGRYMRNKWHMLIFFILFIILAISVKSISIILPLAIGFIGIGSKNRTTATVIVSTLIILLLLSCTWYVLGLSGGDAMSKPLFGDDSYYSVVVPALGMSNPNGIMMVFTNIIVLVLYLCKTKRQVRNVSIVLSILTVVLSMITGSTTGLVIGFTAILLINLVKRERNKATKRVQRIAPWAFGLATVATFIIAISFGPSANLPNPVNDAMTTRPFMWNLRIENNSYLNIYGSNDQYHADASTAGNGPSYALDNMTLYILVQYGIVVYLIFFYIFYAGSKRLNDPILSVYVLVACMLMFVERMYLYSFILIFLQKAITDYYLMQENSVRKKRKLYA